MQSLVTFGVFLVMATILLSLVSAQDCDTEWSGCNIDGQICKCDIIKSCDNPFKYNDKTKCQMSMYADVCEPSSCQNNGICLQLKNQEYICQCSGTGYYGKHCENSK
ncbi:slit homolog 1 protein-like [Saccoglossus kowalevskii]